MSSDLERAFRDWENTTAHAIRQHGPDLTAGIRITDSTPGGALLDDANAGSFWYLTGAQEERLIGLLLADIASLGGPK